MLTTKITNITISPDRQRRDGKDSKSLTDLKADIAKLGLFHAPILTENLTLVIGERRLLAMKELHEEGITFTYDGQEVPKDEIPYTRLLDLPPHALLQAELSENLHRLNLSWQELAIARVRIHEALQALNPAQTKVETATAIVEANKDSLTPTTFNTELSNLIRAQVVAANLHVPAVAAATTERRAYELVLEKRQQELHRDLVKFRPATAPHNLIHGDCRQTLLTLESGSFDLILSDPPYGINAHKYSETSQPHNYDDSPSYALDLYKLILRRGFDLLKPQGAVFVFCDIDNFHQIRLFAEQMAYSTWRTPIIWHKGPEGHAPWGRDGFKRTYEIGLYAVKGQRPMVLSGGSDVKLVSRPTVNLSKLHAAEKPPELLRWLLQLLCRHGDRVLDPCCGSAPIFPAAKGLGLHITAIEQDNDYHTAASSRLYSLDQEETPPDHIKPNITEVLDSLLDD